MRIVSLLPSATEIIAALGLADDLVGVTHECDWPPAAAGILRVTRTHIPTDASSAEIDRLVAEELAGRMALYSLDFDALASARPDLIVTQTLCDVCAVNDAEVRAAVARLPHTAHVVHLEPTRFEHVLRDIETVAAAAGVPQRGREARAALEARVAAVRAAAPQPPPPRVAVLEWLDPPYSSGHWTPELVALAGGREPLAQPGTRSRRITFDELAAADPDVLAIACCGFSIERTLQDVPGFLRQAAVASLRSVQAGQVYVCDGSAYFSRPGPRLVDSLEGLLGVLSPGAPPVPTAAAFVRLT